VKGAGLNCATWRKGCCVSWGLRGSSAAQRKCCGLYDRHPLPANPINIAARARGRSGDWARAGCAVGVGGYGFLKFHTTPEGPPRASQQVSFGGPGLNDHPPEQMQRAAEATKQTSNK
jgi:hypothetical protein